MEVASLFLTTDHVAPLVTTTVAQTYLKTGVALASQRPQSTSDVESLRDEVGLGCFQAAAAVERVLHQVGEAADRVVLSRGGGIAFIFLGGARYAMLEADEDGSLVALLSDRSSTEEAETWIVEPGGLTAAVRKVRAFVGPPHGANP